MAFKKHIFYDFKTLLLVLIGIPWIASTNIDCGGKPFRCLNSTHFMICVVLGEGVSSTVDDNVIHCPTPTECNENNRFECALPVRAPPPPPPTLVLPIVVNNELETTTEEFLVDTISMDTGVEQHLELSTINATQEPITESAIIPLQTDILNEITTTINNVSYTSTIPPEVLQDTTVVDQSDTNIFSASAIIVPATEINLKTITDFRNTKNTGIENGNEMNVTNVTTVSVTEINQTKTDVSNIDTLSSNTADVISATIDIVLTTVSSTLSGSEDIVTKTNTVGDLTNYDTTKTVTEPYTVAMTTLSANDHNDIISTQVTTTISANISNDGLEISNLQEVEGKTSRTTIGPSSFSTTSEAVYKDSPKLISIDNVTLTPFINAAGVENSNDTSSFITEASFVTTEAVDNEIITMTSGVTTYDMGGSEKTSTIYVTAKSTIPDVTVENMQFSVTQQLLVESSETTLASNTVHLKSNENYSNIISDNVTLTVKDVDFGSLNGSRSSVSENIIVTEIDFKTTMIPEVTEAYTDYNTMLPTTIANVIADQFPQNRAQIVDPPQNKINTTTEHSNAIPITHPYEQHNPNFNLTDETTTFEIDFNTTAGSGVENVTLQDTVLKNTKPDMINDRFLESSTEKSTSYQNNIIATNNDEISTALNKIVSGTINPIEQKVPITLKPDIFVNQKFENINDILPTNQVAISTVDTVLDFARLNESDNSEMENSTILSTEQTILVTATPSVLVHPISGNVVKKSTENPILIEKAPKIDLNLLKETSETLTTFDSYGRTNVINNLGSTEATKTTTDHTVTVTENETTTDIILEETIRNGDITKKTTDTISTTLGSYGTTNISYTLIPTEASATITDKTFVILRNETTTVRIPEISISENLINITRLNESDNTQIENSTLLSTEQTDMVTTQRVFIYEQSENSVKTSSDNALQIETNPEVDEDLGNIKNTSETSITFQGYRRANETYNLVSTDAIKTITDQTSVSPTENVIDITKLQSYKTEMGNNTVLLIEPIITVATNTNVIERQQLENSAITATENPILIETTSEVDKLKETSESLKIFDDYGRTNVTYTSGYIKVNKTMTDQTIGTIGNETAAHKTPVISLTEIVINNETENSTVFFIEPIIALDTSNVIEHQQLGNSTITSTENPILIETIPQVDVDKLMETSETLTTFDSYGRTNVTYNLASTEAIKTITDHTVIGDESATDRMPEKATRNEDITVSNMQTVNLKPSTNNETNATVLLIMENDKVTITSLEKTGMDFDDKTENSFKRQIITEKPSVDESKTDSSKVVTTKPEVFALPAQSIIQTKNATFATAVNNVTTEPTLHTITEIDIEADNLTNMEALTAKIMRIPDTFVETATASNTTNYSDLTTVTTPIQKQATSGVSETETATQTVFSLSTENPEASSEPLLETALNHNIASRNDNLFIIKNQLSTTSALSHELSKATEPVKTTLQGGHQQLLENAPVAMLIADINMQNKTSTTLKSYSVASSIKQLSTTRDISNTKEIQNSMIIEKNEPIDKSYGNITELTSKPSNLPNSIYQEKVMNSNVSKAPDSVSENPIENILFNETVSTIVWVADGVVTILNDQNVKSIGTANKLVETTAGKSNNFTPEPSVFSDTTKIVVPAIIASQGIKLLGGQPSMETVGNENNFTGLEDKFHSGNVTELLLETENSKKSKNAFDVTPAMNEKGKISTMNDNINGVSQNLEVTTTPITATLQKTYASISLPSLGLESITSQYKDQTIEKKLVSSRNPALEVKTKPDINFVSTVSTRNNTAAENNLGDYFTAKPGAETAMDKLTTSISENVGTNLQDHNEALLSSTSEVTNSAVSEVKTSTKDLLKGSHYSSNIQNTKNTDNVVIGISTEKIYSTKQSGSLTLPESGLIGAMLPSIESTTTPEKVSQATVLEHIRKETLAAHENTEIITESLSIVNIHSVNEQKSQDDIANVYMNRQDPIASTGVPQYFSLHYPEQSTTASNLMQAGATTEVYQPLATRLTNERTATGVTNEWTATEATDNIFQTQSDHHEQMVTIPLSTLQSSTAASLTVSTTTNTPESISTRPFQFDCESRPTGRYADIDDCRKFYICSGIPNPIVGLCPVNTVFSDINKQCTKNLSHCVRQTEFKCVSQGRFSDLIKPNIYHICVKKGKLFLNYKLQCQQGYFLNKATVRCYKIPEPSPPTTESNSQSTIEKKSQAQEKGVNKNIENNGNESECEEEGRFADPYNCRGYYICKATKESDPEYRRRYKKCDSDEVFDREKKTCVDASSYECSYCDSLNPNIYYVNVKRGHHQLKFKLQCRRGYNLNMTTVKCHKEPESSSSQSKSENNSSNETSSQDKEIDRSNSSQRRNKYKFECIEEGKFSDPNNCKKYYKCKLKNKSSISYRRKHKKCDKNEVFHKEKQKCVSTSEYKCL